MITFKNIEKEREQINNSYSYKLNKITKIGERNA